MSVKVTISKHEQKMFLPNDDRIKALLPSDWEYVGRERDKKIAIPHTVETTRLCRNLGYEVPAPIAYWYQWHKKPKPFRIQRITAALLTMNPRAYVLNEMGTGKTRSAMYAIDYLIKERVIESALIVAPLSTLSPVWDREIFEFFPHLSATVLHGSRSQRIRNLREKHHIYIINHDGVGTILPELLEKKIDAVLIDEVGAYRNKSTNRWKQMDKLVRVGRGVKYFWGMTGSPTPNEPTDAWGLAKLITPERAPKYFKEFQRKTMNQITQFMWVPKPDAIDHVYDMLQPAVRYRRDDCVELPEVSYQDVEIPPSKQVADTYKKLVDKLRIAFDDGEVTAANEGVLYNKLLQVSCGWVYSTTKGVIRLDNQDRVDEVKNIINDSLGKVIVFANFTHAAEGLYDKLTEGTRKVPLPKGGVELVTGATSKKERDRIFAGFQNDEYPRVIVAHPQCMSHGLTLTAASTIVWFTPTASLETYEQANARITRPGQTHKGLILHLTSTSIERKIYNRLSKKAKIQGALLELFNDN
jgi:SNF2 family DNA or RNA helicase